MVGILLGPDALLLDSEDMQEETSVAVTGQRNIDLLTGCFKKCSKLLYFGGNLALIVLAIEEKKLLNSLATVTGSEVVLLFIDREIFADEIKDFNVMISLTPFQIF